MTLKSLGNPFSHTSDLRHGQNCSCEACKGSTDDPEVTSMSSEDMPGKSIEGAVVRSVFGHNDVSHRSFMGNRTQIVEHPNDYTIRNHLVQFLGQRSQELAGQPMTGAIQRPKTIRIDTTQDPAAGHLRAAQ